MTHLNAGFAEVEAHRELFASEYAVGECRKVNQIKSSNIKLLVNQLTLDTESFQKIFLIGEVDTS